MKKAVLAAVLALTALGLSSCVTQGSKRTGYDSEACRSKCQRLGQHVSVTASAEAGRCICTNDSTSGA
jgi:hypothetical protein